MSKLVDVRTGNVLNPKNIVKQDSDGITLYENGAWKYIEAERIKEVSDGTTKIQLQSKKENSITYTEEQPVVTSEFLPLLETDDEISFYSYYFGLTEAMAAKKVYQENSAFLSLPVKVNIGARYSLRATFNQPDKTSVEFYIVDGSKVTPILPYGSTMIINEKMFQGQSYRFSPTDTPIIYNNFERTADTIDTVSINNLSVITANYETEESAQFFQPVTTDVRIKTILRCYPGFTEPPYIRNLLLQKED